MKAADVVQFRIAPEAWILATGDPSGGRLAMKVHPS